MGRLREIFGKKTDNTKAGEAATTEDTDVVADEAPDDIPFGLDYRRNTWPQRPPREDLDGKEQGELAAGCEHAACRHTECQNNELGLRCQYTQHEGIVGDVSLRPCAESCVRPKPP
ncbi:hypothetical protein V493_00263 [Pseudogymnoascus sp. VKM F-4281 (FW-2241)]|nr:hypothetical protein V493_00263 [Pseudogymnoascus sp. VKM F-4281 (FW-2241)]